MKYEEYEALVENLNADNALDAVQNLLAKAKEDSLSIEATDAEKEEKISNLEKKYNDLKVDYIKLYTAGRVNKDDMEDEAARQEEETKKLFEIISQNMN